MRPVRPPPFDVGDSPAWNARWPRRQERRRSRPLGLRASQPNTATDAGTTGGRAAGPRCLTTGRFPTRLVSGIRFLGQCSGPCDRRAQQVESDRQFGTPGLSSVWRPDEGDCLYQTAAGRRDREDFVSLRPVMSLDAADAAHHGMVSSTKRIAIRTVSRRLPINYRVVSGDGLSAIGGPDKTPSRKSVNVPKVLSGHPLPTRMMASAAVLLPPNRRD
jgi:hypothetical protein